MLINSKDCRVIHKCTAFLNQFCERDVADFFQPVLKLEIAVAEVLRGSLMPPVECARWFVPNRGLIEEEAGRDRAGKSKITND